MYFPSLPVVDALVRHIAHQLKSPLAGYRVVCVQHLLETTGTLFESFVRLGCRPEDIHVLGKAYSTSAAVERRLKAASFDVVDWRGDIRPGRFSTAIRRNIGRLWSRAEAQARRGDRGLIVLDDGGRCRQFFPDSLRSARVVAVEQTTSGLKWRRGGRWIPTVEVAGSAVKRLLEPPAVTASILRFVMPQFVGSKEHDAVGVVGLGTVGADVARALLRLGYRVVVHDTDPSREIRIPGARWCESLAELFESAQFVLGCTGKDLLTNAPWLASIKGTRVLASCSSEDTEFRTLLLHVSDRLTTRGEFDTAVVRLPKGTLQILRGGFPANFTGTINSGPRDLIQVTRALLLAGVVQAAGLARSHGPLSRGVMLDPALQAFVGCEFLSGRRARLVTGGIAATDPEWIVANSTGLQHPMIRSRTLQRVVR